MKRISVLSQGGKLIGVYVPPEPPTDSKAPLARLVAGPKQKLQEIMIDVPGKLERHQDVEAFHAVVRKKLKLRK
jgi:hypothetical protein